MEKLLSKQQIEQILDDIKDTKEVFGNDENYMKKSKKAYMNTFQVLFNSGLISTKQMEKLIYLVK